MTQSLATEPSTQSSGAARSIRRPGGGFALRAALAVLVTMAAVQYSMRHGRLLRRPVADDANYCVDGLNRLDTLYRGGAWDLLKSLAVDPPHSPFSSLLAMASFAVFGRHDWAPYAGNAVIVLALLTAVDWLGRGMRPWQRAGLYCLVLSSRWPWTAVTEFRPDLATALAMACGIICTFRQPLIGSSLRHRLAIGAFLGVALLLKPAMFPVNLVMFAACLITALAIDVILRRRQCLESWRQLLIPPLAALLICLPYCIVGWRSTYDYIYANVLGNRREIWQTHLGRLDTMRYFLDLPNMGGNFILGISHIYLLLILAALGLLLVLSRGDRSQKFRAAGLAMIGLVAYAIPTISPMKNFFYGATFQTLLLLGTVLSLRWLLSAGACPAKAVFILACAVAVASFQLPVNRGNAWDEAIASSNRLLDEVYGTIQSQGQFGDRIFLPAQGASVSWNTMGYLSACDDSLRRFVGLDYGLWNDRPLINQELDFADWVVLGDPGNSEARADLPNVKFGQALYLQAVRDNGGFAEAAAFPAGPGTNYRVFRRTTPPFAGFADAATTGLRPLDGPHPEWRLPATRAGIGDATVLAIPPGTGNRTLLISFQSRAAGQRLTISIDGAVVATIDPPKDDQFQELPRVDLNALPHRVEIRYSKTDPTGGAMPVILYRKIQLLDHPN